MIADREHSQCHHGDSDSKRGFFIKPRLQSLKATITWSGVIVTFGGIILGVVSGGSIEAAGVAMLGLLLTCCGHLITGALAKRQAAEQAAARKKTERDRWRIDRRIDRIKYGAGGALGHDIEDYDHESS